MNSPSHRQRSPARQCRQRDSHKKCVGLWVFTRAASYHVGGDVNRANKPGIKALTATPVFIWRNKTAPCPRAGAGNPRLSKEHSSTGRAPGFEPGCCRFDSYCSRHVIRASSSWVTSFQGYKPSRMRFRRSSAFSRQKRMGARLSWPDPSTIKGGLYGMVVQPVERRPRKSEVNGANPFHTSRGRIATG